MCRPRKAHPNKARPASILRRTGSCRSRGIIPPDLTSLTAGGSSRSWSPLLSRTAGLLRRDWRSPCASRANPAARIASESRPKSKLTSSGMGRVVMLNGEMPDVSAGTCIPLTEDSTESDRFIFAARSKDTCKRWSFDGRVQSGSAPSAPYQC